MAMAGVSINVNARCVSGSVYVNAMQVCQCIMCVLMSKTGVPVNANDRCVW